MNMVVGYLEGGTIFEFAAVKMRYPGYVVGQDQAQRPKATVSNYLTLAHAPSDVIGGVGTNMEQSKCSHVIHIFDESQQSIPKST